ncbi:PdaC/SigV domain-containing protein [Flavobacterium sp. JP2137]|uniref:DUF3298 and DUF4163 domain-containing protein n=1 Tax=Flavobacterium sp. JP2137 TaxID=3414510 RepID=UPI003D2FD4DB
MKILFPLFASLLVVVSCQKDKTLVFENQKFEQQSTKPCDQDDCTTAVVEIPVATTANSIAADSINKTLLKTVSTIVSFEEEPLKAVSYEAVVHSFVDSYNQLKKEYPKESTPWQAKIKGHITYQSPQLLAIQLDHYTFSGGAHGYEGVRGLNFNPENGHLYTADELILDRQGLSDLVEKKLRSQLQIPSDKGINSTGLMFEDDRFKLPDTFLFLKDAFVAYYNTYEIASYADGPTKLVFTPEEVAPFLRVK